MLWAVAMAAGIGLLCGLCLRVSVLVLAACVTLVVGVTSILITEEWVLVAIAKTFATLFALHGGFVVGAGVRS